MLFMLFFNVYINDLFELCLTCLSLVFSQLPVPVDGKIGKYKIHGVGSMSD